MFRVRISPRTSHLDRRRRSLIERDALSKGRDQILKMFFSDPDDPQSLSPELLARSIACQKATFGGLLGSIAIEREEEKEIFGCRPD